MKKLPKLDENNVCLGRLAAKVRWYAEKITITGMVFESTNPCFEIMGEWRFVNLE